MREISRVTVVPLNKFGAPIINNEIHIFNVKDLEEAVETARKVFTLQELDFKSVSIQSIHFLVK